MRYPGGEPLTMAVRNDTLFLADEEDVVDADGWTVRLMVAKATFDIEGELKLTPAKDQRPIRETPLWAKEPGRSSLIEEGDWAPMKPATDIAVIGSIRPLRGHAAYELMAEFRVGRWQKAMRVIGDRLISNGPFGPSIGQPEPFVAMPILWERCFGGTTATGRLCPENPIGRGYLDPEELDDPLGRCMPNLETAARPAAINRGDPSGLGWIDRGWAPRPRYAGTYDDRWMKTRMPLLPLDFDHRFFHGVPPDMIYPGYLQGGEPVSVMGCRLDGPRQFALPTFAVSFRGRLRTGQFVRPAMLDTLLLDLDTSRVTLVWRAKIRIATNEREGDTILQVVAD